jgi:hypothetical protein
MAEEIKLDLDPKRMLQSITDLKEGVRKLSEVVEESLGKNAPKSIETMDKAAEKGATSIASRFKDLSKRIKEDLKTAFDISGLTAGLKFAEQLGQGIKEVFNLERAFDRLNTRLQLTGKSFQDFKKNIGTSVASTGQKLEDVFPGVETAAAKGNVKSPQELAAIAKALGQVRAATGESTEALADSVVEILRTQGKKINAQTFQQTLDTLQGTRTAGAFKTAGEAGGAIESITKGVSPKQLKEMGLGTRELGGLAAQASKAGEGGNEILQHVLKMATQAGGKQLLNSIFGAQLFKGDKLDVDAFSKVNKNQFGKYSEQVLASATGADQAGLSRFLDVMKSGMADYKKVAQGSNETASQFKTATNNLASSVDQFKERTKNATREVGEDLAAAASELLKGNFKGAFEDLKHGGHSALENKGTIAAALGGSAAAALLLGGGAGSLLRKLPGGKALGGLAGGELAKQAGVTPVYVTNAAEIGGGLPGAGVGIGTKLGLFGLAGGAGIAAGTALANSPAGDTISKYSGLDTAIQKLFETFDIGGVGKAKKDLSDAEAHAHGKSGSMKPEDMKKAIVDGMVEAHQKVTKAQPPKFSNASRPTGPAGGM